MYLVPINQMPQVTEAALLARAYGVRAADIRELVNRGQIPGLPVGQKVLVAPQVVDEALLRLVSGEASPNHPEAIQ